MPVYNIKDFDEFGIPFRAIAADVETGEEIPVLQERAVFNWTLWNNRITLPPWVNIMK